MSIHFTIGGFLLLGLSLFTSNSSHYIAGVIVICTGGIIRAISSTRSGIGGE
jgi:hypothetical protein